MASNHTVVTDPHPLYGKLTLDAIPFHDPILITTFIVVLIGSIGIIGSVLYFGKLKYVWDEWLTSVDHKKIGIMYILVALIIGTKNHTYHGCTNPTYKYS